MLRLAAAILIVLASTAHARAQSVAPIDTLFRALGLPEIVEIMRQEGIGYGESLDKEMLDGRGGARWQTQVTAIYQLERMRQVVRDRLDIELAASDLAPMIAFFGSDQGRRIVGLEISARRALLDKDVEEASRAALDALILDRSPRLDLIRGFAEANDLIELNVVGALNANFAFYQGLAEGGALSGEMTEEMILADVWGQEEAIRDDTEEWLFSYLAMAYKPLSDADIRDYIAFSETAEGARLNQAIFNAFDEMFVDLSQELGLAASNFLAGQEL